MADIDPNIVWLLVGVMLIQGVWMIGLTYLVWKRHQEKKKAEEEEATTST